MRTLAIILAILAQAAALAWVVVEREDVYRNGSVVYLRTAPVDPRDVFRGDYVQLAYDINRISLALADKSLHKRNDREAIRVYASLTVDERRIATVTALHTEPPADGVYLRGYTSSDWQLQGSDAEIGVKFGIEKLFVAQGAGLLMEERRGTRDDWQTSMEVEVAIGNNGIGVIRDHRWTPLATRLEILNPPERGDRNEQPSPRLRFSIRNEADAPITLANPGDDCSIAMLPVDGQSFEMIQDVCSDVVASSADVVVLKKGEVYAREIDTALPRWHITMRQDNKNIFSGEIGKFNGWQRLRLRYSAPENVAALSPATAPLWMGDINSAAFSNQGRVD